MESLADPSSLRDEDGVSFDVENQYAGAAAYEQARERFADEDGVAVVGVTNDAGEVLLADTEQGSGWLPPGKRVDAGGDWVEFGREAVAEQAGVDVKITDVERVQRMNFRVDDADDDRETTTYVVYLAASPADSESVGEPGLPDEDAPAAEWFDGVPEDVDEGHGDDVRVFLD